MPVTLVLNENASGVTIVGQEPPTITVTSATTPGPRGPQGEEGPPGEGGGAVESVNGQTGDVVLDAGDVGAATAAQGTTADSALQPGDAAGGVLGGTYPDPTFAVDMATQAELNAVVSATDTALSGKQPLAAVLTGTTASYTAEDDSKLAGIETGADVTDAANVAAAGAQMVYVHNGSIYVLATGRVFVGPEDPTADGFTMGSGDEWIDPS